LGEQRKERQLKDEEYSNFLFKFLLNKKISYEVLVVIFICAIFLIPKILFFELGLGLSWTNIFFISNEFINQFPVFWGSITPQPDYFNILGILGITIFLIFNKRVYEQLYQTKWYVIENREGEQTEKMKVFESRMRLGLKIIPLLFMILLIIGIPLLDFFVFSYSKYIASVNPNKLFFYIQNYYGLSFFYAFFICMLILTFATSSLIYRLTRINLKPNVMDPDGAAGLQIFGRIALKNILGWMVLAIIIIFNTMLLAMTRTETTRLVLDFIIIGGTLLITLIMFLIPLRGAHDRLLKEKYEALDAIDEDFLILLSVLRGEAQEIETPLKNTGKVGVADLLPRLDFIVRSNYYSHVLNLKEWPINSNILVKTIIAILTPIIFSIVGYLIEIFIF